MIRVLIADDQALLRGSFRVLVDLARTSARSRRRAPARRRSRWPGSTGPTSF